MATTKLLLVFAALTAAAMACTDVPMSHDLYNPGNLPVSCNAGFKNCTSNFCACVGLNYDDAEGDCGQVGTLETNCTAVGMCQNRFVVCVNHGYADITNENVTCSDPRVPFFHAQALLAVLDPTAYNTSQIFESCAAFICGAQNHTNCTLNPIDFCVAPDGVIPEITMTPGSTPAPTNPDGSYAVPTYVVTIVMQFLADFDGVFNTAGGAENLKNVSSKALSKHLGYKTLVKLLKYISTLGTTFNAERSFFTLTQGSLTTTSQAEIPTSETGTLNAFLKNVDTLKTDTSTGWYSDITAACQNGGGCVGGLNPPTVLSVGVVIDNKSSSSTACGAGCIAGAVIGSVVGAVLIVGLIIYCVTKKNTIAPDASKA